MHFSNSLKVWGSCVESQDHESWKYDICAESRDPVKNQSPKVKTF